MPVVLLGAFTLAPAMVQHFSCKRRGNRFMLVASTAGPGSYYLAVLLSLIQRSRRGRPIDAFNKALMDAPPARFAPER
jgi:hypothetical protein